MQPNSPCDNSQHQASTESGSVIQGDVTTTDGDFVGRDKHIHGDEVHGDKIIGDKIINQGSRDPAPLSAIPLTARPLLDQSMVGRESDLEWLHTKSGDRLLVGQPGAGKTFLLYHLVLERNTLFVVSRDRGEIAAALETHRPSILIVDDAHVNPQWLLDLRQLRATTGSEFSILASCWPGDEGRVAECLGISRSQVHLLDPLTRDEMVEVIKGAGLHGSNRLIQEIVDQAEGRPGLAVTLARLCLEDGVKEVVYGDRLSDFTVQFYEQFVGPEARTILAAFSIGGNGGFPKEVVARYMEMRVSQLLEILTKLEAGGVLMVVDQRCLSVRPPALRYALIRDVFYTDGLSLEIEPLLAQAVPHHAAQSLIGARSRGAAVPEELLLQVVQRADSDALWRMYASLGQREARWVLERFPDRVIRFARICLESIPRETIPLLLHEAIGDQRLLNSYPDHPLRMLQDWVCNVFPGRPAAIDRRNTLFALTRSWLLGGNDLTTSLRSFAIALSLKFKVISPDPGSGMSISLHFGSLQRNELERLLPLWNQLWEMLENRTVDDWTPIWEAIEDWAFPIRISPELPEAETVFMQNAAVEQLKRAVVIAQEHPAFLRWAGRIAQDIGVEIAIPLPDEFLILYPYEDLEHWEESEAQQRERVRTLASRWAQRHPTEIVQRIQNIEQEALRANLTWPRWTPIVCYDIAGLVSSPCAWLGVFMESGLSNDLVYEFLKQAAAIDEPGWIELATECLHERQFRNAAISVILAHSGSPQELVEETLGNLDGYARLIQGMCLRHEIPEERVRLLLRHKEPAIASAAAAAEWNSTPKGSVRPSLYDDWRQVVIRHGLEDYLIQRVLVGDAELAYEWLEARMAEQMPTTYRLRKDRSTAVAVAVDQLSEEARSQLLIRIAAMDEGTYFAFSDLFLKLVGDSQDLYGQVLSDERLQPFHLVPFAGQVNEVWIQQAIAALDAGYGEEQIAKASSPPVWTWSGKDSDRWGEFAKQFECFLSHSDERIQEIGTTVRNRAIAKQQEALARERREAVYGS